MGFSGPPSEPDVQLSLHPALHVFMPLVRLVLSLGYRGGVVVHLGCGDGTVTASNALVKLLRLQQVAAGFAKADRGEIAELDSAKESLLREMLEDTQGERVVVFCRFHHDLDTVRKVALAQKRSCGEISGRVTWRKVCRKTMRPQHCGPK